MYLAKQRSMGIPIVLLLVVGICNATTISILGSLLTNLTQSYNTNIRPPENNSEALNINTSFFAMSMIDYNDVSGVLTLTGGIHLFWFDPRLAWTPSDYSDATQLLVKRTLIWTPDIFITNPANDLAAIADDTFVARIYNNGMVQFSVGSDIQVLCSSDMTFFPFDVQSCSIIVGAWGYLHTEVNLNPSRSDIDLTFFSKNNIWDIDSTSATTYAYGDYKGYVEFTVNIRRKPLFFTLSMMAPMMLLAMLNPFVFLLPVDSGERVSYSVTIFLAFAVFLTLVSDSLPKSSTPMASICFVLFNTIMYSSLIIIATMLNLRLHHADPEVMAPKILSKIVYFFGFKFLKGSCKCDKKVSGKVYDMEKEGSKVTLKDPENKWELESCKELAQKIDNLLFVYNCMYLLLTFIGVLILFSQGP